MMLKNNKIGNKLNQKNNYKIMNKKIQLNKIN